MSRVKPTKDAYLTTGLLMFQLLSTLHWYQLDSLAQITMSQFGPSGCLEERRLSANKDATRAEHGQIGCELSQGRYAIQKRCQLSHSWPDS